MRGWSTHLLWETTLARALEQRGAAVVFATCGGRLPICDVANTHSAPPMPCASCREYAVGALDAAGYAEPITLRDLVDVAAETRDARARVAHLRSVAECETFVDEGLAVGRMVRISVAWFLARGSLPDTEIVRETYRSFLVSGQVIHRAFRTLLDRVSPDQVLTLNGTFFAESILCELARSRGVPVATYEKGFLADSIVVTHDRAAVDFEIEDAVCDEAARTPLRDDEERRLDDYLDARVRGERTLDRYWDRRVEDEGRVSQELGLRADREMVALFSNILWDSAIQGKEVGFVSMPDWLVQTIRGFALRPQLDLVVRLHPAEVRLANHRTLERMSDVIEQEFPTLPENVRVVPPESPLSSYTLARMARLGLVYTSTIGMEMAAAGIPVIVAARTHYRGRGFTFDVATADGYWSAVDDVLTGVSEEETARQTRRTLARRYANLFFFRFTHHLPLVTEPVRGHPRLGYSDAADLEPGRDAVLDLIVESLLSRLPVVAPLTH
jgi:hypothetical protein